MHNRYHIRRMDYVAYWIIGMGHLWDPCLHNCKWKGKVDYVAYWIISMGHLWDPYFHLAWPALIENLTFGSLLIILKSRGNTRLNKQPLPALNGKQIHLHAYENMLLLKCWYELPIPIYIHVCVWISMCILLVNCWVFNTEWHLI